MTRLLGFGRQNGVENVLPNFNPPSTLQLFTLVSRNPFCSGDTTTRTLFQSGNSNFRGGIRYTRNYVRINQRLAS